MFRKTNPVTFDYHYPGTLPDGMVPAGMMDGNNPMSEIPAMYNCGCPMPDYSHWFDGGSHLGGNPHGGAFAGAFFSPFFFPFFFRRRFFFFPFFPFF